MNVLITNIFAFLQEDTFILKEQLRKAEEQIQATRQEVVFLTKELSDAVNMRDKTMADLHTARLENEKVKKQLDDAVAELKLNAAKKDQVIKQVNFKFPFCSKLIFRMSYVKSGQVLDHRILSFH